ncbi:acyl-CoA dehydrogenase family protein [Sinorhizobium mexicanum]|uniref:acyl-CoA dehydrogenase family protein n=1 Tax=Sinorhizobium mexicanum TaxID=375549 RepID=UPI001FE63827|nr:acyl-CoA dehydrogenase family protein [Sinorhizobium mexicanum]
MILDQAMQFMLADMSAARLLIWNAAWRCDAGLPFTKESSHAKPFAGDLCARNVWNARKHSELLQGIPIERFYRDAKIHQKWDGTS